MLSHDRRLPFFTPYLAVAMMPLRLHDPALRRWLAPVVLAVAFLLAGSGSALLATRIASHVARGQRVSAAVPPATPSPDPPTATATAVPVPVAPAAVSGRLICSFSNADAAAALIQGADGGASVVAGDRTWWLFGDTLFLWQSGKQIEANSIAWSTNDQPGQCPHLSYHARNGIGVPFLAKDGSLTVWPSGALALDGHTIALYVAYVYGSGPYAYWIGEIGVATLDTATMQVTILNRSLWNKGSGFPDQVIGVAPVDTDAAGNLRLVLQTLNGDRLLARVPRDRIANPAAYSYWDGQAWSADPAVAASLWSRPPATDPVARLASFDNGASIAYNPYLRKYISVDNVGFDKIGARVADRLEGPWSAPTVWIDCSTIAKPAVPTCYSPFQHPQLASDGGRTLFLTFTRMATYDVVAYQVTLDASGSASSAPSTDGARLGGLR